jgi:hypothetical protein
VELARLPDARDIDALVAALRDDPAPRASRAPAREERPTGDRAGEDDAASAPSPRVAVAAPPGVALSTERQLAQWGEIVKRASARNSALGEGLRQGTVQSLAGDLVRLAVPEAASKARGTLLRREMQLAFGQVARELLGSYLRLEIVDARRGAAPGAPVGAEPGIDMRAHPAVRRVTEATGGRLLTVERVVPESVPVSDVLPPGRRV